MIIYEATMLTDTDLFVNTNYGPLFLDKDDFKMFNFDPYYVVDFYDTDEVNQLIDKIKQYYTDEAIKLIETGEF